MLQCHTNKKGKRDDMQKRFITIWFRYLKTDWFTIHQPKLHYTPFVLVSPDHGRMVITEVNHLAYAKGINKGMVLADARAIFPSLQFFDDKPELSLKLLKTIAEWCIRFTPIVAIDPPDGIILEATGCAHLWGDEKSYLNEITLRLKNFGYEVRAAMADTIGAAWAITHFGEELIIKSDKQTIALLLLPVAALRLEQDILERLQKLGLIQIQNIVCLPRSSIRRRFGNDLIHKLDQALGNEEEVIHSVQPIQPYQVRLPCLEPIVTAAGIEIALKKLLELLCKRLQQDRKGARSSCFKCYRIDGKIEMIDIGTNHASHNIAHLFKLFELKISTIEPALGIELFVLEASKVEDVFPIQEKMWDGSYDLAATELSELIDRLTNKIGANCIHRYFPDEHYWPERSIKLASSFHEKANTAWKIDKPRPVQLLSKPETIQVAAPIPDYPPMLFRYKDKLHKIIKADGPERIECEWWLEEGPHRDYYCVEDEDGNRYWLFRSGHYSDKNYEWFLHGFFA
jgi:protein ImuB